MLLARKWKQWTFKATFLTGGFKLQNHKTYCLIDQGIDDFLFFMRGRKRSGSYLTRIRFICTDLYSPLNTIYQFPPEGMN